MKKMLSILLALMIVMTCAAALADEVPQPEGGKKFEGDWALTGGLVEIVYEEEGYRVAVDLCTIGEGTGTLWEYSCLYNEAEDALVSVSSTKRSYTYNLSTLERTDGEPVYYGAEEEAGKETVFSFAENGSLKWTSAREPEAGADLEFRSIGRFNGSWYSAEGEEPVWVDFHWLGLESENFCYEVYLHRGDDDVYTEFTMTGVYDEETGKLTCTGRSVDEADTETYEAVFSMQEDGKMLYEAANGIVMEYDLLGANNG